LLLDEIERPSAVIRWTGVSPCQDIFMKSMKARSRTAIVSLRRHHTGSRDGRHCISEGDTVALGPAFIAPERPTSLGAPQRKDAPMKLYIAKAMCSLAAQLIANELGLSPELVGPKIVFESGHGHSQLQFPHVSKCRERRGWDATGPTRLAKSGDRVGLPRSRAIPPGPCMVVATSR
jgi:hypothetical protein